jgi:hypothetical protein
MFNIVLACFRQSELSSVIVFTNEEKFNNFLFSDDLYSWLANELNLSLDYFSGDCYIEDITDLGLDISQVPIFYIS